MGIASAYEKIHVNIMEEFAFLLLEYFESLT